MVETHSHAEDLWICKYSALFVLMYFCTVYACLSVNIEIIVGYLNCNKLVVSFECFFFSTTRSCYVWTHVMWFMRHIALWFKNFKKV